MQNGFYSFAGLALGGRNHWKQKGLSFMSEHTQSQGSCWSWQLWLCWRGLSQGPDFPVWEWTCIDGNPVECKLGEVLSTPTTNPVLELPMCVWGGNGDFKIPNHTLEKGIRAHQGEEAKQGGVVFDSIAPIQLRSEVHICSCHELRSSWVPLLSWRGQQSV